MPHSSSTSRPCRPATPPHPVSARIPALPLPLRPSLFPALFLVFCLVLCLTIRPAPAQAGAEPLASLALVQQGIDECNSDYFHQAVDLSSVLDKASDALLAALRAQTEEGHLGEGGLALAVGMLGAADENTKALLKPLLLSEVRGFVNAGINGGYFAGKPNGSIKPSSASLAGALNKIPPGRRRIVPGKLLSKEDDRATVSATFIDPKAGDFPLLLEMKQENGLWRVKEISNSGQLFQEASRREN